MSSIEFTDEERAHIRTCLAMATATTLGLPGAQEKLGPLILAGIVNQHHRHIIEKVAPEQAAQIEKLLEELQGTHRAN